MGTKFFGNKSKRKELKKKKGTREEVRLEEAAEGIERVVLVKNRGIRKKGRQFRYK